jgi:hypothetical protein
MPAKTIKRQEKNNLANKTSYRTTPPEPEHYFKNPTEHHFNMTVVVAMVLLASVVLYNFGSSLLSFRGTKQVTSTLPASNFDYKAYVDSLNIDEAASKKLMESIISEEDIRKEVQQRLAVNQPIPKIEIPNSQIKTTATNQRTITEYVTQLAAIEQKYSDEVSDKATTLFTTKGDEVKSKDIADSSTNALSSIKALSVPTEAVEVQKGFIIHFSQLADLAKLSTQYYEGLALDPWPNVYQKYVIVDKSAKVTKNSYDSLSKKYSLIPDESRFAELMGESNKPVAFGLVKTAHAQIITTDVWQKLLKIAEQQFAASFTGFLGDALSTIVKRIEQTYVISNFLYYNDALVQGQYVDDYLNKYVPNDLDKQLAKRLIPQFNCGNSDQTKQIDKVLRAKAQDYRKSIIGSGVSDLDYSSPGFAEKMAALGDQQAFAEGWQQIVEGIAAQAQGAAQDAAQKELLSSGKKTTRDADAKSATLNQINGSISTIANAQLAALISSMNLGSSNVSVGPVEKVVQNILKTLFDDFLFSGTQKTFKEQAVCVGLSSAPVLLAKPGAGSTTPAPANDGYPGGVGGAGSD